MNFDQIDKPDLEDLFGDFSHPNPKLNEKAFLKMASYWPEESMERLILNLDNENVDIRRKTVKALAYFGCNALRPLAEVYLANEGRTIRTSCLKVFVKIAANYDSDIFPDEVVNVIKLALEDDTPEITLTVISLLRQLGHMGLPFLIRASQDENLLRARAAITALGEMDGTLIEESLIEKSLTDLLSDNSLDQILCSGVIDALETVRSRKKYH